MFNQPQQQRANFAKQRQAEQQSGCGFCKRNREPVSVYSSHQLKNQLGQVTCPQLSKYRCELCGSTGVEAHTRSYCPQVISIRQQQKSLERSRASESRNRLAGLGNISARPASAAAQALVAAQGAFQQVDGGQDDDQFVIQIELGRARMMSNMGSVSHSRYNSAGRLRNPPRFNNNQASTNRSYSQQSYRKQHQQPHNDTHIG